MMKIVLTLACLSAMLMISTASEPSVPPLEYVKEIDVDIFGPGTLYFIRIAPNGAASLARASQLIGICPAGAFDFTELCKELSACPQPRSKRSEYYYVVTFPDNRYYNMTLEERKAKGIRDAEREIMDTEIVRRILKTFVESVSSEQRKYIQKCFSYSPPFQDPKKSSFWYFIPNYKGNR